MKLLHTSDWHVGRSIRGASRADEHRAVLNEIVGVAAQEQVDLVIVAGDLFDSAAPTPEAEEIVYRALLQLADTGAQVAVIAGNHDNARRLRAIAPLFALGRVHVVAEPIRPDDGGVLSMRASDGCDVRLAMLPFVSKRGIVRAEQLMAAEGFENAQVYSERLRLLLEAMCAPFHTDTVNVLTAHAFVLGAAAGGGERAAHLVDEYAVTAQSFPPTIGYAALGHLHRPQRIHAGAPLHYCGSPIQLDFGEGEQAKQVNVVSIEPGTPADVQVIGLRSGRPLRTLRGTIDQLAAISVEDEPWLRVIVEGPTHAGLADQVREMYGDGVVEVRLDTAQQRSHRTGGLSSQRSPQALFDDYLQREQVQDDRVRQLFHDLLEADQELHPR